MKGGLFLGLAGQRVFGANAVCTPGANTFCMQLDLFAGMTGHYVIDGKDGASPELSLKIGETYTFDQTHASNWMHPVGFAYFPDGAHGEDWGSAERAEIEGAGQLQYKINGANPTCDDAGDTGLDCFEPDFFLPRDDWLNKNYIAELTITQEVADASHGGVLYYFCHIHSKMSGKIRILNPDGTAYTNAKSELPLYSVVERDEFDTMCGTTGVSDYRPGGPKACDRNFLGQATLDTDFENCFQAIDCQMNTEMRVVGYDSHNDMLSTFMQMMVPHHINAINMAKIMLKLADTELTNEQTGDDLEGIMWAIAGGQGYEIHQFMNYLGSNTDYASATHDGSPLEADEFGPDCDGARANPSKVAVDPEVVPSEEAAWSGCQPGSNTFCAKVDLLEGEAGYYRFAGSTGNSPDLTLTIGETYVFDQTHASNWFHPLGFAYKPDGAHGATWGGDELEEVEGAGELQYKIDGSAADCADAGDTGLDCYEPEFFFPREKWMQKGYTVELTVTPAMAEKSHNGVLFYFCHIHSKMSGRILLKNADGSAYTNAVSPVELYSPLVLGPVDRTCGTAGVQDFAVGESKACDTQHLCGTLDTNFERCMEAINCKMMKDMQDATAADSQDKLELFMQQMIPHHVNAVNMARIMLKYSADELSNHADLEHIMNAVVNNQNHQIHIFRNYLGSTEGAQLMAAARPPNDYTEDPFVQELTNSSTAEGTNLSTEDAAAGAFIGFMPLFAALLTF